MELNFEQLPRFKSHAMTIWSLIPEWSVAHQVPHEAIVNQIYISHAWCNSNPLKAPKKNPVRFLWSWMASAKRYGNLKTPEKPVVKAAEKPNYDMTVEEMKAIRMRNMPQKGTLAAKHQNAIDAEVIKDVA